MWQNLGILTNIILNERGSLVDEFLEAWCKHSMDWLKKLVYYEFQQSNSLHGEI